MFGQRIIERFTPKSGALSEPRLAALAALALGVLLPALVAWVAHRGSRWARPTSGPLLWALQRLSGPRESVAGWFEQNVGRVTPAFSRTPLAWDFAVPYRGRCFIRIETTAGKFIGGWFAEDSFVSTYPEPHDLFIEQQWRMDERGVFLGPVLGSAGFWYAVQPGDTIDWIDLDKAQADAQETEGQDGNDER